MWTHKFPREEKTHLPEIIVLISFLLPEEKWLRYTIEKDKPYFAYSIRGSYLWFVGFVFLGLQLGSTLWQGTSDIERLLTSWCPGSREREDKEGPYSSFKARACDLPASHCPHHIKTPPPPFLLVRQAETNSATHGSWRTIENPPCSSSSLPHPRTRMESSQDLGLQLITHKSEHISRLLCLLTGDWVA